MYLIATIGPRSCDNETIDKIISGGANTIRINLSHGNYETIDKIVGYIRRNYFNVKLLMDIQGNKIRVSNKLENPFYVDKGEEILFCSEENFEELRELNKNKKIIPLNIDNNRLFSKTFKKIYLKDGIMAFKVKKITDKLIETMTVNGGMIRKEKGCNLPGVNRQGWGLTDKDLKDIQFAINEKVDILCYSYCSYEKDCDEFKEAVFNSLRRGDTIPKLFGKIETKEAVMNVKNMVEKLDGFIIARGDLVPESSLMSIPIIQEKIAQDLSGKNKDLIIATHILNSMKYGTKPTVNELNDIYNMVKKNATGFMLTGETTVGKNHYEVVKTLDNVLKYYEKITKKIKTSS
ncbi:MAG: pyruvate kinase [Sarcina sp.]